MNEEKLNTQYICNKTLLDKDDELVPIILEMIKDSYKSGLCQSEFDNTMRLIEENQELKKQLEEYIKSNMKLEEELSNKRKEYQDTYKDVRLEIKEYKTQQKEFIKYLENKKISPVKSVLNSIGDKNQDYNMFKNKLDNYEEILQKYKEIIGGISRT